jgi:diguanylate cyclase (GGDEF)-like protein
MGMARKISLKTKIASYSLLVFFTIVPITAYLTLTLFHTWYAKNIEEHQMMLVTRLADELDDKVQTAHMVLIVGSKLVTPDLIADPHAAEHFIDTRLGQKTIFDNGLFLFTPTGKLIAESWQKPSRIGLDLSYREYIQRTLKTGKPYISDPFISSQEHKHPIVMFTVPVFGPDGGMIAIYGGSIDLLKPNLLGKLAQARIGRDGYFFLFDRNRTMIMHPDRSRIMKNDMPPGMNKRFDLAVAGVDNSGDTVNSKGIHTVETFKQLRSVNWVLATDFPSEEAFAPVKTAARFALLIIPLGGVFIAVVMWCIMRRLTAPILSLTGQIGHLEKNGDAKRVTITSHDEIEELAVAFNSLMDLVQRNEERLYYLTVHDNLTGLYNRTYFEAELERIAKGRNFPISIIVADVDGLKLVNDTLGHSAGDRLIKDAARLLLEAFRAEDVVSRIGGDEFAVLLGETNAEAAEEALQRVRGLVAAHSSADTFRLGLSLGVATAHSGAMMNEAMILADQRMYHEKAAKKIRYGEVSRAISVPGSNSVSG